MPNRPLTLVLCVLVLLPRTWCPCLLADDLAKPAESTIQTGHQLHSTDSQPGCPHSDPDALAESLKPLADDDDSQNAAFSEPAVGSEVLSRDAVIGCSSPPPSAGRLPRHLAFCVFRN